MGFYEPSPHMSPLTVGAIHGIYPNHQCPNCGQAVYPFGVHQCQIPPLWIRMYGSPPIQTSTTTNPPIKLSIKPKVEALRAEDV